MPREPRWIRRNRPSEGLPNCSILDVIDDD
jgi:hypothetical protein